MLDHVFYPAIYKPYIYTCAAESTGSSGDGSDEPLDTGAVIGIAVTFGILFIAAHVPCVVAIVIYIRRRRSKVSTNNGIKQNEKSTALQGNPGLTGESI